MTEMWEHFKQCYTQLVEKLQTVLKEVKLHYEEKLVDQINANDKRFWNYTRHFTKTSSTISDLNFEGKTSQMIKLKQT